MYNHILYLFFWLVSFFVFYLTHLLFPENFVLGNWKFTVLEAGIYSSFWLVVFLWVVWDFLVSRGVKFEQNLVSFIYFWAVNAVGIWLVAKLSQILGLGITGYPWAVGVGFVVNLVQRLVWKFVTKRNLGY